MKRPAKLGFTVCATLVVLPCAAAPRIQSSLAKLDKQTRLEQVCDIEAMRRIRRVGHYLPDRAMSSASAPQTHRGDTLIAPGAAFRSRGKWYELAFTCTGTEDHMKVTAFSFTIGDAIPAEKWPEYGLWK
jgi:hypothetical protein